MININKISYIFALIPMVIFCNFTLAGIFENSSCFLRDTNSSPHEILMKKLPQGSIAIKIVKPDRFNSFKVVPVLENADHQILIFFLPEAHAQESGVVYDSQTALYSQEFVLENKRIQFNQNSSFVFQINSHCLSSGNKNTHEAAVRYQDLNEQEFVPVYKSSFYNWEKN